MKAIPLSARGHGKGLAVLVDDDDVAFCEGRRIFLCARGLYPAVTLHRGGKKYVVPLHRAILNLWPGDKAIVDHINGDRFDCRRSNLRTATAAQNAANRRVKNKTGFKGVATTDGRHYAFIHGRVIGRFPTPEAAGRAYDNAAREAFGSFAAVNFPCHGESPGRPTPTRTQVA